MGVSHVLRGDFRNCIPRSLPWRESLGGEGDRGCLTYTSLTSALVSSKALPRREKILFELEGEASDPERRVRYQALQSNVTYASMGALCSTHQMKSKSQAILKASAGVLRVLNATLPLDEELVRSFMVQGVDGEFNFLLEGGLDENRSSTKSVNNEAPVINVEPIFVVHPSNIAENSVDSCNTSSKEGGLSLIVPDVPSYLEVGKISKVVGKRKVVVASYGDDPYRKAQKVPAQASKLICTKTVLDNVLNGTTRELISALHKARTSSDTIRESEIQKDKARVNGLHTEYSRLILEEKKWINYEQTLSTLRARVEGLKSKGKSLRASDIQLLQEVDSLWQDRAAVVARVIPDAAMKLIHSDEMEEMPGHRPSSKEEYDRAGNDLADASYPFLAELTADPHTSVEQLLSKKPQSLQSKRLFLKASYRCRM
ncbi:hypothetical protein Tco_0619756 [Tanacetum coccineum]